LGLLERLGELGKALLTTDAELRHLRDTLADIRQEVRRLATDVQDLRERLVRLEASREADRAHLEAQVSRFMIEVKRAELRLTRVPPRSEPPPLPESET
jgi:predicted  nucleic acid-binding Zn-ribbon protein